MEIYGHRGARGEAPENTVAGCRHAVAAGVRRIEIDLRLSADRRWVVFHDETLERITGRPGRLDEFDAAVLAGMDASGGRAGAWAPGTCGIPTLDALLAATPEIEHWQLEVKPTEDGDLAAALAELCAVALRHGPAERYALTSLSPQVLAAAREGAPELARGLVATQDGQLETAAALGCRYLCLAEALADRGSVAVARAEGFHVSVWTVNDAATLHRLRAWRADSAITDLPTMALAALAPG